MASIQILIVEDESIIAEDIKRSLLHKGYMVNGCVNNGADAVESIKLSRPDIVLMDIMLAGEIDGIETAAIIKERYGVPIIYLTAYVDDNILERAKQTCPYAYIPKPYEERILHVTIEMVHNKYLMELKAKENERYFYTVLKSIGDAVIVSDVDARIQFMNPVAEYLTGWRQDEALNKDLSQIFKVSNDSLKSLMRNTADKTPAGPGIATSSILIARDEGHRYIDFSATQIVDERHKSLGGILVFNDISERMRTQQELSQSLEAYKKAMSGIIQAMALTVESKDPYTAGHQNRVAELAGAIGKNLSLPDDTVDGILMAGVVHDLGKISVPVEILSKPGKLTAPEFNLIKTHPQIGYDILKTIEFPWPVAIMVYQHHERIDGSGYPLGLKGDEILFESRILAVADVVEAMASHRPYRAAIGIEKALAEIKGNRGKIYDASVVDSCLDLFENAKFTFPAAVV